MLNKLFYRIFYAIGLALKASVHRLNLVLELHRNRSSFASGIYVIRANLAFKIGAPVPRSLIKSRGHSPLALAWPILRKGTSPVRGQALCLSRAGSVLIFNFSDGNVERIAKKPIFNAKYSHIRDEMSHFLPAPHYSINKQGLSVTENLVDGNHLSECCDSLNLVICASIISGLYQMKIKLSHGESLGDRAGALLGWADFLVPSHGDLGSNNIIASDDSFFVIDWDPYAMDIRPAWYDPLTLIGSSDMLREAYITGFFHSVLELTFPELTGSRRERSEIINNRHLLLDGEFRL